MVTLSISKNMNGLFVSREVEKSMIRADQGALDECKRLRKEENIFESSDICNDIPSALLLLLNIRGIFRNNENIVKDDRFHAVPLICLTETNTPSESDLLPLQQHFHCHAFLVHNNTKKYKSLLLLFNWDLMDCINFHEYDSLICATIKSKTSELCLTVVLRCREDNVSEKNYVQYMECIIARHNPYVV